MKEKQLFAFVGPSGSGKTTIVRHLAARIDSLQEAISITTRMPRVNEVEGVDYYYVSQETFDKTPMYEETCYAGNHYGLSKEEVNGILKEKHLAVAVDINGLKILQDEFGDRVHSIFVYAPIRILRKRMKDRGDSDNKIQQRLENIEKTHEYENIKYCDYLCQNTFPLKDSESLRDLERIVRQIMSKED